MREYLLTRKDFHPLKRSLKPESSEKKKRSQIKPNIYTLKQSIKQDEDKKRNKRATKD